MKNVLYLFIFSFALTACSSNTATVQPIQPASISADATMLTFLGANVLHVMHPDIQNWFMESSQLCADGIILNTTLPCDEIGETLVFTNVRNTSDGRALSFTIQSTALVPDTAVGVFTIGNNSVTMLTNYYLGNQILSASPNGVYIAVQKDCFEARCGIDIFNVQQKDTVVRLNHVEYADQRQYTVAIQRWLTDNSVEYALRDDQSTVVETNVARW